MPARGKAVGPGVEGRGGLLARRKAAAGCAGARHSRHTDPPYRPRRGGQTRTHDCGSGARVSLPACLRGCGMCVCVLGPQRTRACIHTCQCMHRRCQDWAHWRPKRGAGRGGRAPGGWEGCGSGATGHCRHALGQRPQRGCVPQVCLHHLGARSAAGAQGGGGSGGRACMRGVVRARARACSGVQKHGATLRAVR